MDTKIRVGKIKSYTATDGKVFAGKGSKSMAEKHQWFLDKKALSSEFDVFMRKIFGIKCEHTSGEYSEEESEFCEDIMREVAVCAEDGNFKEEVSEFILDLFGFVGQERWLQIHNFLVEKRP